MLMQAQPVYDAYRYIEEKIGEEGRKPPRVIYVTPQGSVFNQQMAHELAGEEDLVFLCGHYEGIDERVLETIVTDYISIGDYVLTGGELPSMVMIDAISRLVPGVLKNKESAEFESFHNNLLEYPQYTRPEIWRESRFPRCFCQEIMPGWINGACSSLKPVPGSAGRICMKSMPGSRRRFPGC